MTRIHVALTVADLPRSVAFYRELFGREPEHVRPDHAKFAPDEPRVNFTLNAGQPAAGARGLSHLGIEVESPAALAAARQRLQAAGLAVEDEHRVDCCYALQDKFWVRDPDGNPWEHFLVHESTLERHAVPEGANCDGGGCC